MSQRNDISGIIAGAVAGACWGFVFLAPELVRGFTPFQLAVGRYLAYGIIALSLVAPRLPTLLTLVGHREWKALLGLNLLGNLTYYVLLASAVQLGGVAMPSLVVGFLPVAVTLIGSRHHGAIPLRKLWPALVLASAGIACVGGQALMMDARDTGRQPLIGFVCALAALIAWTAYAIWNRRCLERLPTMSAHDWNLLSGLVTGILALLLAWPAFIAVNEAGHGSGEWLWFAAVAAGLGLIASIIGNACWNHASRILPLTMVGQLILFETLFALLYGFLWDLRWPTGLEWLAMTLVAASVPLSLSAHRQPMVDTVVSDETHP